MKGISQALGLALLASRSATAAAVEHNAASSPPLAALAAAGHPYSRNPPWPADDDDLGAMGVPDITFQFPKNGTFELIQSLTEILAFEAREAQGPNPPPGGGGGGGGGGGNPSPGTPPKKKEPYKCACHCTLIICGCTCRTLPLPSLPPGSYEQGGGPGY